MNLPCEQPLLGFDLDFLLEPSNTNVVPQIVHGQNQTENTAYASGHSDTVIQSSHIEHQQNTRGNGSGRNKKADINSLKKKLVSSDLLLRNLQEKTNRIFFLDQTLLDTKTQFREACIERDTVRQAYESLEKEANTLRNQARELEQKLLEKEQIDAAALSHSNQLRALINQYEKQIESDKAEKASSRATIKDLEKKVALLMKYNEESTSHLSIVADIIASKRPLTRDEKLLLSKYLRLKKKRDAATGKIKPTKLDGDKGGSICEEFLSDTDGCPDNNEKIMSPPPWPPKMLAIQKSELNKNDADGDADITIEVNSIDTGRGSSLAFSDSDTIFSPEYFINSPPSMLKLQPKQQEASTSPQPWNKPMEDKCSSPITIEVDTSQKTCDTNTAKTVETVDRATSPGRTSKVSDIDGIEPLPTVSEHTTSANNRHSESDNIIDGEVEMILNRMKLSSVVTPIPPTPARSHGTKSRTCELSREPPIGNNTCHSAFNNIVPIVLGLGEAIKQLAKNRKDITVPNLDDMRTFFGIPEADISCNKDITVPNLDDMKTCYGIPEADISCNKTPEVIDNIDLDVPYQHTSRFIDSPEPDVLFDVTGTNDEQECVNSNLLTTSKITPSIQIEDEEDMQECVHPISSQMPSTKINIKDKILFEKDRGDQPESTTNHDKNDSSVVQEVNISSSSISKDMKKISKAKKLTRLGKLRKNLIPKRKIRDMTPPRTLRSRTKADPITPINNISINNAASSSKSSAPLNNTDVYEKAVRVMAALKSQNETETPKIIRKCKKRSAEDEPVHKYDSLKLTNEENSVNVTTTKQKVVSFDLENVELEKCHNVVSKTNGTNDTVKISDPSKSPISIDKRPQRNVPEESNNTVSIANEPNDIVETSNKNNKPTSIEKTPRGKVAEESNKSIVDTNVSLDTLESSQNNTPTLIEKTPQRKVPEEPNHSKSITDDTNMSVDTDKISNKNDTPASIKKTRHSMSFVTENNVHVATSSQKNKSVSIEKTLRRKSDSYEIDNILFKSRKKYPSISLDKDIVVVLTRSEWNEKYKIMENNIEKTEELVTPKSPVKVVGSLKRVFNDKLEPAGHKRILRSSARSPIDAEKNNNERKVCDKNSGNRALTPKPVSVSGSTNKPDLGSASPNIGFDLINKPDSSNSVTPKPNSESAPSHKHLVSYNDLDIFNEPIHPPPKKQRCLEVAPHTILNPQKSVLCKMIQKYGIIKIKMVPIKVPETTVNAVNSQITESIAHIIQLPPTETQDAMKKMIKDMQKWTFNEFLTGLMVYLTDHTRKLELLNKVHVPPAPPMTKAEQVLLYIVTRLSWDNIDTVDRVLRQIEYTLFRLNQNDIQVKVVESMAHFYAVLCRYIKAKNRLRLFVLDAMYCINYKSIALIKQCIDVWMHILPLAHMGTAKSPLVTCLVYLLHFFKCNDTEHKVQDMRNILKQKYFFQVTDWDETKILEMFKTAILELRDNALEKKMLRLALILLAKRSGVKWCQNKIVKCMLMPMIIEDKVPERAKAFCISILGAIFKPYPENMKVHCEIAVNQLTDMLDKKPSPVIEEAIYTSLILLSKHNQVRVVQALLAWQPKQLSPDMEKILIGFVKEMPVRVWQAILSKVSLVK